MTRWGGQDTEEVAENVREVALQGLCTCAGEPA